MVRSILDSSINYPEINDLAEDDKEYDTPIFEVEIKKNDLMIAIGQPKYAFIDKNIVYYPIYLVVGEVVKGQIGVYEIFEDKVPDVLDEDGDIDIDLLGEPLLYSYITEKYLNDYSVPEKSKESEESEEGKEGDDEGREGDDDGREGDDEGSEEGEEGDDEGSEEGEKKAKFSSYPEQTEKLAVQEKKEFNAHKGTHWIETFFNNNNFSIRRNDGCGDCLFYTIRDGLAGVGRQVSVPEMRRILADNITEDIFEGYKLQYDNSSKEVSNLQKELSGLVKDHNLLKKKLKETRDRGMQKLIVEQASEISVRHRAAKHERDKGGAIVQGIQIYERYYDN